MVPVIVIQIMTVYRIVQAVGVEHQKMMNVVFVVAITQLVQTVPVCLMVMQ